MDDLVPIYHSHLYYLSKVTVFDDHIADGHFPSLSEFTFRGDPHGGQMQTCSMRMDEAIYWLKEEICQINRDNF